MPGRGCGVVAVHPQTPGRCVPGSLLAAPSFRLVLLQAHEVVVDCKLWLVLSCAVLGPGPAPAEAVARQSPVIFSRNWDGASRCVLKRD